MDLNSLTQNPEQIHQLIELLQSLLPKKQSDSINIPDNASVSVAKSTNYQNSTDKHTNKFLNMPEMNMHKEDHELDKKLAKHPPVARAREYDPINVICRLCGKKETISPSLVESANRYKCNKCSSTAG